MARMHFAALAMALLCTSAFAQPAQPKVDPVQSAAAGVAGAAVAPALSTLSMGLLKPQDAQYVASNAILAANSVKDAKVGAGKLVGGLLTKSLDAHRQVGQILVDVVSALNSLSIAGLNLAAGVTNGALTSLVGKIRGEALTIGNIYTELLGEFGRFVGGSITAVKTLKRGVFSNPLALGVGHLEKSLQSLITFLEAATSPSVAGPNTAAKFLPHLATLKAVKGLLDALQKAIAGPQGALVNALDGASAVANGVLGGAAPGQPDVAKLLSQALGLIAKIPGL